MRNRFWALALIAGLQPAMPTAAQTHAAASVPAPAPPDLSGLWVSSNRSSRGLLDADLNPLRPAQYLTPAGAAAVERVRPALDPSALCLPAIPRQIFGPYPIEIVQRADRLAMLFEWDTVFRLIYTDGRGHPDPLDDQRFMGHAVGRWEDGVLVVSTSNFNGKTWLEGSGIPMSTEARLTEQYWLEDEGETLRALIKIEDPVHLSRPVYRNHYFNRRSDWSIREYVCAEGNRDNVFQERDGEMGSLTLDDEIFSKSTED